MANLMPLPKMRFTNQGRPLIGGKVFFYVAGTSTPKNTFKDRSQSTLNSNPVILDSNGEADIWFEAGYYKVVLKSSTDVLIWTVDSIAADAQGLNLDDLNAAITAAQAAAGEAAASATAAEESASRVDLGALDQAVLDAQAAAAIATGAVSGSVNTFFAATKAAADSLAAGLGDGATVIVDRDETAGGVQTRRVVTSGVLGAPVNELDAGQVARGVVAVDSIADLLALPEGQRKEGLRYLVKGYHAGSDVGGGTFYWDPASVIPVDGGVFFSVAGVATGRWIRILEDGAVHTDYYGPSKDDVSNDAPFILAAKAYAETYAVPCIVDDGRYFMGGTELVFDLPISFTGSGRWGVIFRYSADLVGSAVHVARTAYNSGCNIKGMQFTGVGTGTGLSMGNSITIAAVDNHFEDLRFVGFALGHSTTYSWCNTFTGLRFQNCTQPFIFGSQTNTCTFNTCSYVGFTVGGSFINCEGLLFNSPNIANFAEANGGFSLSQSVVRMVNPYIELPSPLIAQVGGTTDTLPSSLHILGGVANPGSISYADRSVVVIEDVRMQFGTGGITIIPNGGRAPGLALHRVALSMFSSAENTQRLLLRSSHATIGPFGNAFGGGTLTYELHREYYRVGQAGANNGILLSNSLVTGRQYTVVASVRREGDIQVAARATGLTESVITSNSIPLSTGQFKRVNFVFTAQGAELRWIFQGTLQVKLIEIHEGVVEDSQVLPSVARWSLASAPVAGTWARGDIVDNSAPSAGSPAGWYCTVAGTPGTWKAMANLAT